MSPEPNLKPNSLPNPHASVDLTTSPAPSSQIYRPSIDGLRALAILSVVLFHLNPRWMPGGFVGVDIFFVISGFLITTVIVHEDTHGRFSFGRFYQRRIARLFPSMFLVVVLTFAVSVLLYDPRVIADNGPHMAESVLSVANIFYMHEGGGYFGITTDTHPFLHFWSLSVEEQFYLFFPATLLILRRFASQHLSRVLSVLFFLSLACCLWMTHRDHDFAFYMLPTRAWEMLAGALLATGGLSRLAALRQPWRSLLGWAGLVCIILSFALVRENNFPGYVALLPVCGAIAIIAGSGRGERDAVQGLLSTAPLVYIGRISYTLYLWHLPVFCLVEYRLFNAPRATRLILEIGLTVVLTLLTSFFVENPARRYFNLPNRRRSAYVFAAVMVCVIVPVGIYARVVDWPEPKMSMVASGGIALNSGAHGGQIVLMGDSQACALGTTLHALAVKDDMRLNSLCISGSVPLPGAEENRWQDSLAAVKRLHPDVLVLEIAWEYKLTTDPERLSRALDALQPYAKRIILVTQPPREPADSTREAIRNGAKPPFYEVPSARAAREQGNAIVRAVHRPNVIVLDTDPYFTNPDGSIKTVEGGRPLFFDPMHLSRLGEQRLAATLNSLILS